MQHSLKHRRGLLVLKAFNPAAPNPQILNQEHQVNDSIRELRIVVDGEHLGCMLWNVELWSSRSLSRLSFIL